MRKAKRFHKIRCGASYWQSLSQPLSPESDSSVKARDDDDVIPADIVMRQVPYLPVTWILTNGARILIRNLEGQNDIRAYYNAMKAAAASGKGYGVDELPDFAYFVKWYISGFYNIIHELLPALEQKSSVVADLNNRNSSADNTDNQTTLTTDQDLESSNVSTAIAYCNFGPPWFSRSVNKSILCDGNIIISPRFRGRKLAAELHSINMGIAVDVNMRHAMSETAMSNLPAIMSTRTSGTITGSIPLAIYFRKTG